MLGGEGSGVEGDVGEGSLKLRGERALEGGVAVKGSGGADAGLGAEGVAGLAEGVEALKDDELTVDTVTASVRLVILCGRRGGSEQAEGSGQG
jgi:hypothetical protein